MMKKDTTAQTIKFMENVNEFKDQLNDISKTWDQLILLSQLGNTSINMSDTKTNFNDLTSELVTHLCDATLKKVQNEMYSKAEVTVDIVIRNLFERTADIGFLSTDDDIREFLLTLPSLLQKIQTHKNDSDDTQFRIVKNQYNKMLQNMKQRFEEYVAKYSVYYDIVLFNTKGDIVVKLDETNDITTSSDPILELAKTTQEEYVETFKAHDFLPQHQKSLVYTFKVTKTNDCDDIIGFLSLCFRFENEMEGIFQRLINKHNKETLLLLDKEGVSIASSDPYHIPLGVKLETELEKPFLISSFAGRDYIIKTCQTNGYEGFFGLGWMGHIMIPLESAFEASQKPIHLDEDILYSIMQNEELFGKALLEIPQKAIKIQDELDRAVWNGNVSQSDTNHASNTDFARSILREVRQTGEKTKTSFNIAIEKLNQTIITSLLDNVTFLASLSIDIMDRNLYERANDCRWWALTSTFKKLLSKPMLEQEDKKKLSAILKYINDLYTVYTNLFIYDTNGTIVAISNEDEKKILDTKITNSWVDKTLKLKDSSKYTVSPFEPTHLYHNRSTYIYGASITSDDESSVVGGIGIVFDSTPQFYDMLKDALPKVDGKIKNGIFSFFIEKPSRKIVATTNEKYTIGEILHIDEEFTKLSNGESDSKIVEFEGKYYIIGVSCSSGYREYKSSKDEYKNDLLAVVFIEAGEIVKNTQDQQVVQNNYYDYSIHKDDEVVEIATFYIGDKWLGLNQTQVVEAISANHLETPISTDIDHHFKGSIYHKEYIVSVIDIQKFIKNQHPTTHNDIIIVQYEGSDGKHMVGLVANRLGEIMKVPKQYIKPFDNHLISGGMISESIVQPPKDSSNKSLLTMINIAKIEQMSSQQPHNDTKG
jgi:chemotaxis signal transduction protein